MAIIRPDMRIQRIRKTIIRAFSLNGMLLQEGDYDRQQWALLTEGRLGIPELKISMEEDAVLIDTRHVHSEPNPRDALSTARSIMAEIFSKVPEIREYDHDDDDAEVTLHFVWPIGIQSSEEIAEKAQRIFTQLARNTEPSTFNFMSELKKL